MTDHVASKYARFGLRSMFLGMLAIAIVTGFVVQQVRLTMLQEARRRDREPILLFRDPSVPGRIGAWIGGRYVFFEGEAQILNRKSTLLARTDGERLVVEWGERTISCTTMTVDPDSGCTVIDDPRFFERLGLDFDLK